MTSPSHLFFYGVLQENVARWSFLGGLGPGVAASTRGMLYAIPSGPTWYPALIPTEVREAVEVRGMIHEAGLVDLAEIDAFEGADYERQRLNIARLDGSGATKADTYVWIAQLPTWAELIAHGDFARWLEETGRMAYSGS